MAGREALPSASPPPADALHTQDCIDAFYSDGGQSGCICRADNTPPADALRDAILRFCDLPATLTRNNLPTFSEQLAAALAAAPAPGLDAVEIAERVVSTIEGALEDQAPEWLEAAFHDAIEAERARLAGQAEALAAAPAPELDALPETEAVRRCATHHACACHYRLAEIGRRYLARLAGQEGGG